MERIAFVPLLPVSLCRLEDAVFTVQNKEENSPHIRVVAAGEDTAEGGDVSLS